MIRNIVFDMGNVLIRYDTREMIAALVPHERDVPLVQDALFGSIEWLRFDRGVLGEDEVLSAAKARLPAHLHTACETLCRTWHDEVPRFSDMEALVQRLQRRGLGVYLLSNTSKRFHEFRKNVPALEHFTGCFISADCGLLKPDPAIYRAFCQHFSLAPEICFFIDDVTANIEAAMHCGMQGHVFNGDVVALVAALRAAGVAL